MRFSISGEIVHKVSRQRWPRVQTAALLGRFNLDVAKQNRAACFHDLSGPLFTEPRPVGSGIRIQESLCETAENALPHRPTPTEMLGRGPWRSGYCPDQPGRYPDTSGPSPNLSQRERRKAAPVLYQPNAAEEAINKTHATEDRKQKAEGSRQ